MSHPGPDEARTLSEGALLELRVQALEAFYGRVQTQRMHGVPLLNPVLRVQALGFRWRGDDGSRGVAHRLAEGILITPWFMNLVRLPADDEADGGRLARRFPRDFGVERFDFLGSHGEEVGYHETCALFSPMSEFKTQEQAEATAWAALALTHPTAADVRSAPEMPTRRAFLLGRRPGAGDPG